MEEKKVSKTSISTFFLFLAIIVIIVMTCYIYLENTNSNKKIAELETTADNMQNTINSLQVKINSISNATNSDNVLDDKNNNSSSNEYSDITKELNEYSDITKELDENELFKITKAIDNNDGTFTLMGKLYRPYIISESELDEILNNRTLEYNNTKLIIKNGEKQGTYDLCPEQHKDVAWYTLEAIENSKNYKMVSNTEYTNVWRETEDYRQLRTSSLTKCIYSVNSYEELTDTVENVFGKDLYFGGYFKFSFNNNECVSINEVVIGH